ncbi:MAG: hypothetical protein ACRD0U_15020 [Acidimicrobiales bacterium]
MSKLTRTASALVGVLAVILVLALPAHAAPPSTTVSPEGDYVSASLPPGGAITVTIEGVSGSCTSSSSNPKLPLGSNTKNQIPTAGNPSVSGQVKAKINKPSISNCETGIPGTTVTVATSGKWQISLQFRASGSTGTIKVPQAGVVVTTSGLANCTGTVAPNGRANLKGAWTNGSPSTLAITNAVVPIVVTGGGLCPVNATTATVTVTYQVTDVSNPGSNVTVTG